MLPESQTDSWTSARELRPSQSQLALLSRLSVIDAELGLRASERTGEDLTDRQAAILRILPRVKFELAHRLGPVLKPAAETFAQLWYRAVGNRRRVAEGTVMTLGRCSVEVHALNGPSNLVQQLNRSVASHWVLTRETHQLLASARERLRAALSEGATEVWIGDSRNRRGARRRQGLFSRLVARQVDALGPVMVVTTERLRSSISPGLSPLLWPLAVALHTPETKVAVIPHVLGVGEPIALVRSQDESAAVNLVREELAASRLNAVVSVAPLGRRRVEYQPQDAPLVSIVIPTRGSLHKGASYLTGAVASVLERSSYPNFEFIIVADEATPQSEIDEVDRLAGDRVHWLRWDAPFNFSAKMNLGAACAAGSVLLFLNDDIEAVSPDWIERMLGLIGVDGIGYVGALLFFDDQTIQHAGHFYSFGAGHIGYGQPLRLNLPQQLWSLDRPVSGVTAACSAISAETFFAVGGFSERFPGNYNDVDLCFKLTEHGVRMAVAGGARLYHFESKSRNATVRQSEHIALHARWSQAMQSDPHVRRS